MRKNLYKWRILIKKIKIRKKVIELIKNRKYVDNNIDSIREKNVVSYYEQNINIEQLLFWIRVNSLCS